MTNAVLGGRRSAIEIVHEILSVCDNGGVNKTAIMYRSNLSYDQLRRYLSLLSGQHLIERNEAGRFETTPSGEETMKQVSTVLGTLQELRRETKEAPVVVEG